MSDFDDFDRFDPIDSALGSRLRDLTADHDIDANAVLAEMRPVLRRARQQRRARVAASGLASVMVVAAVGFSIAGNKNGTRPIDFQSSTTLSSSNTSTPQDSTQTTGRTSTTPTFANGSTATTRTGPPGSSTNTTTPTTGSTDPTGTRGSTDSTSHSSSTTQPSTTTVTHPQTQTINGLGGSVTVTFTSTTITVRSYNAAGGYSAIVKTDDPDRYRVRFSNGTKTTDIDVRVHNGALEPVVQEN